MSDIADNFRGSRCRGCHASRHAKDAAMGALPARLRAEPRTGSLRLINPVALLADSGTSNRNDVVTPMEGRASLVPDVEPVPRAIVLAAVLGTLDPFDA